nr:MAG TPA: hypothetical protein [Caudoviricetes sp.]
MTIAIDFFPIHQNYSLPFIFVAYKKDFNFNLNFLHRFQLFIRLLLIP